ncbi:substrate-binding domain-containing protein [Paenibacillus sp. 32352]|uniref:sugar ABC transporter substrate-binding protein n=1 Tax=Paenibacillus sp. 32352 TaxID=1969111 RepID=UPI0015C44EC9|nr:substrate-binding domain-containing protein [Paenibacillus sp. 32352]
MQALVTNRALLILCCIMISLTSGCKQEPTAASSTIQQHGAGGSVQKKGRTFAIVYSTADVFHKVVTSRAEAVASKLGAQLVIKAPDEANLEQQIRMMENLIKQRVDGIAVSPVNADALAPYINKAVDAGIQVICFDNDAPQSKRAAFIGVNNYEAGRMLASYIDRALDGKGMIIAETGTISYSSIQQRVAGLRDYLARLPEMQLLELRTDGDSLDKAIANVEKMIDAHPHFEAYAALDSLAGSAAILVWKAKGLSQLSVTTSGSPELLDGVMNKQITALMSLQEDAWGDRIIQLLNDACDGKAVQEWNQLEPTFVTQQSLKSIK